MKKKLLSSLTLAAMLFLAACGNGATSESTSSSESSQSSSSEEVVTGASEQQYTDPAEMKDSYDIIIIGSGGAGMSAAIQAKDAGLNPVIFEKMPVAGGNTIKSSAGMNASQTKFQEKEGITDSNDLFYEETLKGGKGTNDPELLRYLVDNSSSAIDWLDSMGITLDNLTTTGGMSQKRTHRPTDGSAVGEYLVAGLLRNLYDRKVPLFVNSDVVKITEKDGKVTGVELVLNGKDKKTISAKAVVIATGGYGANMDMVKEYQPQLDGFVTTNQSGSTGDGIKMAQELGAATTEIEAIQIHPTVEQKTSMLITEAVRGEGAILVSQAGTRFFNEMETRDKVSQAIIGLPEKYAYLIFDASLKDRVKAIAFYEKQGVVESGETLEALAEKIGVPADALKTSLENWNGSVESGTDSEFGRTTAMENPLATAPYYAIKIAPGIHHTMGGVKINTNTQVLKEDGSVINGLYAAGEVTGGIHGQNRIGGNAVADIIIFGRQAGTQSAAYAKE
ncbi:flavocytochrome c [Granulicatella seriolae]|uniref:Flavocytochrome c n=1 Tax=Granulicatella seriolae TaxID=2967226 RepID=A0ABT1WS52_9LACT|nr:flavocytochrome c [Granulicatella seriolae]